MCSLQSGIIQDKVAEGVGGVRGRVRRATRLSSFEASNGEEEERGMSGE